MEGGGEEAGAALPPAGGAAGGGGGSVMAAAGSGAGTSTRGGGGSSAASRWFFSREQLENTPSRRCGVEADKELSYRQQAANLIQDMGQRLNVYPSGGGRAGREGPGRGARGPLSAVTRREGLLARVWKPAGASRCRGSGPGMRREEGPRAELCRRGLAGLRASCPGPAALGGSPVGCPRFGLLTKRAEASDPVAKRPSSTAALEPAFRSRPPLAAVLVLRRPPLRAAARPPGGAPGRLPCPAGLAAGGV